MWMSGPTVAVDQRASTNGVGGRGGSSAASNASNTATGAAVPAPWTDRLPRLAARSLDGEAVGAVIA